MWNKAKEVLTDLGERLASNFESVDCPSCGHRINYGTYRYERYCPECGAEFEDSVKQEDMTRESGTQTSERSTEEIAEKITKQVTSAIRDAQQPPKEIYKEREVVTREIVKIRCRHCGRLHEEKLDTCPHCGAPS